MKFYCNKYYTIYIQIFSFFCQHIGQHFVSLSNKQEDWGTKQTLRKNSFDLKID